MGPFLGVAPAATPTMTPQQALLCIAAGIALLRLSHRARPPPPASSDVQRHRQPPPAARAREIPSGLIALTEAGSPPVGAALRGSPASLALVPVWARLAVLSGWLALLFREASAGKLLPAWGSIGAVALVAIAASSILLIESLVGGSRPDGDSLPRPVAKLAGRTWLRSFAPAGCAVSPWSVRILNFESCRLR